MIDMHYGWNTKVWPVVVGFLLSILCTAIAYLLVAHEVFTWITRIFLVAGLGVLQTFFQLVFFFHLGHESKPRWNIMMFGFMLLVVFLVIGGSIWIMYNLDYNMML